MNEQGCIGVIHHPDRFTLLALLVVALTLFAPVVVQPGALVYPPRSDFSDLTVTHWPNIEFALTSLRVTGRLPLWRPTIMSGTPFASNPLSGMFYFPHVVFLVLPLAMGFNVLYIAHVWLAGCSAYALLRAWQVERAAALVGALTWMATPKLFAHLGAGHVGMVEAVAWLPLAVLAAHHVLERRRVMHAVWLGAVWAVQFLADPRVSFYGIALTITYAAFYAVGDFKSQGRKGAAEENGGLASLRLYVVLILGALFAFVVLSAVLWIPFAEFVTQSNRHALTLAEAGEWSLSLHHLVGLLIADWGGFHEWMVYVGILPLVLAVVGAYCVFRHAVHTTPYGIRITQYVVVVTWLVICLFVAALFSLGTNGPLFPLLFRSVPGLTLLRVPPRAWFIVAFATACLCAFGVQAMLRSLERPPGWLTLTGVAAAAFAAMFGLGGFFVLRNSSQAASARAAMLHLALAVPAAMAVVLLRARGRISPSGFAVGAALVTVATLLPVDLSLYRVVPEAQAFSDHASVAQWLSAQGPPGTFRVYSPSYSLPQLVAQRAGLELADGVDPMQVASYARTMEQASGMRGSGYSVTIPAFPPDSDVWTALRDVTPDVRLLGKLNVRYVVAEFPLRAEGLVEQVRFGTTFVYENQLALPRAFVGETAARVTTNTPDRVVVEADGPGMLTLNQVYYSGWRATVDGQVKAIQVVDSTLTGVSLDAGHHAVEFVFDPWTVKVGVLVSGMGWGGLLLAWLVIGSGRRTKNEERRTKDERRTPETAQGRAAGDS